jgi:hypothetical protein
VPDEHPSFDTSVAHVARVASGPGGGAATTAPLTAVSWPPGRRTGSTGRPRRACPGGGWGTARGHLVRGWLADDGYPEPSCGKGVGHCVQRPGPEAHLGCVAAVGPLFGPVVSREVVGLVSGFALLDGDREAMVDGHDQSAAGLEDAPQLGQRCRPALQVVQYEGRDDVVERAVWVWQRVAEVGYPQVGIGGLDASGQAPPSWCWSRSRPRWRPGRAVPRI